MSPVVRQTLKSFPPLARLNHWRHARFSRPEYDAGLTLRVAPLPAPEEADAALRVDVSVANSGRHAWTPERDVRLELSLVNERDLVVELQRLPLPRTVTPGASVELADLALGNWRHAGRLTVRARMLFPPSPFVGRTTSETTIEPEIVGPCIQLSFWNVRMAAEAHERLAQKGDGDFPVRVLNAGTEPLGESGDAVAWHLETLAGESVLWDAPRVALTTALATGERDLVIVPVSIPPELRRAHPEGLRVRFDVVREGAWWASNGTYPPRLELLVRPEPDEAARTPSLPVSDSWTPERETEFNASGNFPDHIASEHLRHTVDAEDFAAFERSFRSWIERREELQRVIPGAATWGVIEPTREKVLEYYLTLKLLEPRSGERFLDIASCTSLFPNYAAEACGLDVLRQDLYYEDGVHEVRFPAARSEGGAVPMRCIGSDACELPLDDASVDAMTLHCSLEHFEGDADRRFFREAMRVLRPGGRVLVIPFYCGKEHSEVVHPHFAPGCRFQRYYSLDSFAGRVLSALEVPFRADLHHFQNVREVDPSFYCELALVVSRLPESPRRWWQFPARDSQPLNSPGSAR